jgi:hypothetical protein
MTKSAKLEFQPFSSSFLSYEKFWKFSFHIAKLDFKAILQFCTVNLSVYLLSLKNNETIDHSVGEQLFFNPFTS